MWTRLPKFCLKKTGRAASVRVLVGKSAVRRAGRSVAHPPPSGGPSSFSPVTERWGLWSRRQWRDVHQPSLARPGCAPDALGERAELPRPPGPTSGPCKQTCKPQLASPPPVVFVLGHRWESSCLAAQPPSQAPPTSSSDSSRQLPPPALEAGVGLWRGLLLVPPFLCPLL